MMKWGSVEWMFPTRVRTNNLLVLSLTLFETWKKFATARVSERKTMKCLGWGRLTMKEQQYAPCPFEL